MKDHRRPRFVYVAASRQGDKLKIGLSCDPARRMREIPGVFIAARPGMHAYERHVHRQFAHLSLGNEWYRDDPEIRVFAASLPIQSLADLARRRAPSEYLTPAEAAAELGTTVYAVRRLAATQQLRSTRTAWNHRRFHRDDVAAFRRSMLEDAA